MNLTHNISKTKRIIVILAAILGVFLAMSAVAGAAGLSSHETTPTPKVATPKLKPSVANATTIKLSWNTQANTQYKVEKWTASGYKVVKNYTNNLSKYTVKNLKTNRPYKFRIKGRRTVEGKTGYSKYSLPLIVRTGNKVSIYLTFDDGPSSKSTPKILKYLSNSKIKATFFMLGSVASYNKTTAKKVAQAGHALANHGYSHEYASIYASTSTFLSDLNRGSAAISAAAGKPVQKVFRFPGGSTMGILGRNLDRFRAMKSALAARGIRYYDWDVSLADSRTSAPKKGALAASAIRQIKGRLKAGDRDIVVLAHDTNSRYWTPDEIEKVIKYCNSQGFTYATLNTSSPACQFR